MNLLPDDTTKFSDALDKELVEGLWSGDEAAFIELYKHYYIVIFKYLKQLVMKDYIAKDLTSITIARVFQVFSSPILNPKGMFYHREIETALLRVAQDLANEYLRRHDHSNIATYNTPQTIEDISILRVSIIDEPLTAQNLSAIITTITDLYTRCWLIQQKRFSDLMDYTQTHDHRFIREANLQVGKCLTIHPP